MARCNPCESGNDEDCQEEVEIAYKLKAVDDSCGERVLQNKKGFLASDGNSKVFFTDLSDEKGTVQINPPDTNELKILGIAPDGTIVVLDVQGKDGSVIGVQNGAATPISIDTLSTLFTPEQITDFSAGSMALFGCGPGSKIRLGKLKPAPDTVFVYNSESKGQLIKYDDLMKIIVERLCSIIPDWNGADCVGSIIACGANGLLKLNPLKDKILIGTGETSFCWNYKDTAITDAASVLRFVYTGGQQYFTVPTGATYMQWKMWGSGAAFDGDPAQISTSPTPGVGGYTTGKIPVSEGAKYSVIVGGTNFTNANGFTPFGFGGAMSTDRHNHAGGGLTGIFTGESIVTASDFTRAIAIAGGGGAPGRYNPSGGGAVIGSPGHYSDAGGAVNMQGVNATPGQTNGTGGGGGGYRGGLSKGLGGRGGSGFNLPSATDALILAAALGDTVPPGTSEPEYVAGAGIPNSAGYCVVIFS